MKSVVLIPGDGIGPELTEGIRSIFSAAKVPIEWVDAQAGLSGLENGDSALPETTLELIRKHRVALKGPTTTPSGGGHRSVNVMIRKRLGLFANVRPVRSLPSVPSPCSDVDLVIVRENLEDTYSGVEYMQSADVAVGYKLCTRVGVERCVRFAFEFAMHERRKKLTCVHKANIHKLTDGMFQKIFYEVAKEYPSLEADDYLVDNMCMQLVRNPQIFDVCVMPNLYGDIVSDLCAGLVGGLGVAPSANVGSSIAVFEAVHGSAPDIAGKDIANPIALLRSGLMMLRYLGFHSQASMIYRALEDMLSKGYRTKDLGGELSRTEFVKVLIDSLDHSISDNRTESESFSFPEAKRSSQTEKEILCIGVDIAVRSPDLELIPNAIGALEKVSVSNRGLELGTDDTPSDVYVVRYRSSSEVSEELVAEALHVFDQHNQAWIQCEKLFLIDGKEGFS